MLANAFRRSLSLNKALRPIKACRMASTDPASYFHYTRTIVGSIPSSFAKDSLRKHRPSEDIDLEKARADHAKHIGELKKLVSQVIQIPPQEEFPDMVFVEDPAVVHDGRALLTNMHPPSRHRECLLVKPVLEELGLQVVEIEDPDVKIDGGDVLFTGREFLVGLSGRTNAVGRCDCTTYRLNLAFYILLPILIL